MEQQTAVEWLIEKINQCEPMYSGIKSEEHLEYLNKLIEQAKQMEKQQIIDAINNVSENNVKYANMIVSSWSQIEGELFMHNTKQAEQYYNETFKKNNL